MREESHWQESLPEEAFEIIQPLKLREEFSPNTYRDHLSLMKFPKKDAKLVLAIEKIGSFEPIEYCEVPEHKNKYSENEPIKYDLNGLVYGDYPEKKSHTKEIYSSLGSAALTGIIGMDLGQNQNINQFQKNGLSLSQILSGNSIPSTGFSRQASVGRNAWYPGKLEPKDLPELALPIVDFIDEIQPDIIIGCDRGGRLFSLAIKAAWNATQDQSLPTIDGKIHFARISKSEDFNLMQERIDQIVASVRETARQRGVELPEDFAPKILFVDDWVVGGGTKRLAEKLSAKHDAKSYFAVMVGVGGDVSGNDNRGSGSVAWHDRPEEIGVNYVSAVKVNTDGSFTETKKVVAIRSEESKNNRRSIKNGASKLPTSDKELVAA